MLRVSQPPIPNILISLYSNNYLKYQMCLHPHCWKILCFRHKMLNNITCCYSHNSEYHIEVSTMYFNNFAPKHNQFKHLSILLLFFYIFKCMSFYLGTVTMNLCDSHYVLYIYLQRWLMFLTFLPPYVKNSQVVFEFLLMII